MPQTLLSLAGLLIVTLLSFSQQQANLRSQQEAVRAEMQQMAIGVAKQSMEVVRARAFDDKSVSGNPSVSDLTQPGNFPTGKDCRAFGGSDPCDAIEDFHDLFESLDVDDTVREELLALTPGGYTGIADELATESTSVE